MIPNFQARAVCNVKPTRLATPHSRGWQCQADAAGNATPTRLALLVHNTSRTKLRYSTLLGSEKMSI